MSGGASPRKDHYRGAYPESRIIEETVDLAGGCMIARYRIANNTEWQYWQCRDGIDWLLEENPTGSELYGIECTAADDIVAMLADQESLELIWGKDELGLVAAQEQRRQAVRS